MSVSVIIPTYNRAKFISDAIKSVLNQTYSGIREIIVVDDCSTDNTLDVLRSWSEKGVIRYIRLHQNHGGAVARNIGIKEATGEYVAFLDSDDKWLPKKLEIQKYLVDRGYDGTYTAFYFIDESGNRIGDLCYNTPPTGFTVTKLAQRNIIGSTSTFLLRKTVLQRINGFDAIFPAYQDWDLYLRACADGAKIISTGEGLAEIRIHSGAERISNNRKTVLCARELMGAKWESYNVGPLPSIYMYDWAVLELRNGEFNKGRSMLWNTIRTGYANWKAVSRWILSFSGKNIYREFDSRL